MKTTNIENATNSQLSTTEPKKKKKTPKQTTRTGTESQIWIIWMVINWKGVNGGKVQELRSIIGRNKVDRGNLKNSIGNGEAK